MTATAAASGRGNRSRHSRRSCGRNRKWQTGLMGRRTQWGVTHAHARTHTRAHTGRQTASLTPTQWFGLLPGQKSKPKIQKESEKERRNQINIQLAEITGRSRCLSYLAGHWRNPNQIEIYERSDVCQVMWGQRAVRSSCYCCCCCSCLLLFFMLFSMIIVACASRLSVSHLRCTVWRENVKNKAICAAFQYGKQLFGILSRWQRCGTIKAKQSKQGCQPIQISLYFAFCNFSFIFLFKFLPSTHIFKANSTHCAHALG